jgi:hypothetical protein
VTCLLAERKTLLLRITTTVVARNFGAEIVRRLAARLSERKLGFSWKL